MLQWIPLLDRTLDAAFGEGGTLRAWDLQLLGVRPEHHGKGVASAIMRYVISLVSVRSLSLGVSLEKDGTSYHCEQADAENAPMVLETQNEKNVAMYGKMGFEVKDVINVESRVGMSRFWFMGRGF